MQLKDIENLSNLAKIELSSNKKEKFLIDLQSVLNYVEEIKNAPAGVLTKGESEEYLLKNKTREVYLKPKTFLFFAPINSNEVFFFFRSERES